MFLAAVYVAEVFWIAQNPGGRINVSALTWQLSYCAAWVPTTILIWRFTAGWVPDGQRGWRLVARHSLLFTIVLGVVTLVTTAVAMPLVQNPGSPREVFWTQIRGRGYFTLLMYILVASGGAAMTLHDRYRERQAAAG